MSTGDPAFPTGLITDPRNGQIIGGSNGMTLRDYFAAKAMQSWLVGVDDPRTESCAKVAYQMADAMLKARKS
jgi:hypothetical protein